MEDMRIYVASLSDYNNGRLEGKWLDLSDYSDASELMEAIQEMLDELTEKYKSIDGEVREEWAVHDYEGIPSTLASEYMGEQDFQQLYDIAEVAEDRGIPVAVLVERAGDTGSDDYQALADSLMFVVDGNDESDIVHEYENQLGELGSDFWSNHIYVDDVTERVIYGEDVDRFREDILSENPDLDENEAEEEAERMADAEAEMREDLPSYLDEMGYGDEIPSWVSKDYEGAWKRSLSYDLDVIHHDGEMYVFSNNYGVGGTILSGLVGAYIGYKIGRARPQKIGFGTEVRIGNSVKDSIKNKIAKRRASKKKKYETGGGIGFKGLSAKVAKRYEGKKVSPKFQSQYGTSYSKSEAKEVGDKVAGKVYWNQQGRKMAQGGGVKSSRNEDIKECKKLVKAFCKEYGERFKLNEKEIMSKVSYNGYLGHGASVFVGLQVNSNIDNLKVGEIKPTTAFVRLSSDINPNGVSKEIGIARSYVIEFRVEGSVRKRGGRTEEKPFFYAYQYGTTIDEVMNKFEGKVLYDLFPLEFKNGLKLSMSVVFAEGGMTEHGLREGDIILGKFSEDSKDIEIADKNNKFVLVDLDKGMRSRTLGDVKNEYLPQFGENRYVGKTNSQVWNGWSESQRKHFLDDHRVLMNDTLHIQASKYRYNELPNDLLVPIERELKEHIESPSYAKGGGVNGGMQFYVAMADIRYFDSEGEYKKYTTYNHIKAESEEQAKMILLRFIENDLGKNEWEWEDEDIYIASAQRSDEEIEFRGYLSADKFGGLSKDKFSKGRFAEGGGVDEVISINIQGYPYYLKKMGDTTHFKMANSKDGIDMVIGSHIAQHKGEEYYSDVASWLKGGKSPNGKSYSSYYYAEGGGISGLDDLVRG